VTLIDKHGARFFKEAPAAVTVNVVNAKNGWQVTTEEKLTE
jgi:hypothetical protein